MLLLSPVSILAGMENAVLWIVLAIAVGFALVISELSAIAKQIGRVADSLDDLELRADSIEGVLERGLPDTTVDLDDF